MRIYPISSLGPILNPKVRSINPLQARAKSSHNRVKHFTLSQHLIKEKLARTSYDRPNHTYDILGGIHGWGTPFGRLTV